MFRPLHDRVLIRPEESPKVTEHGILLPDKDEQPVIGIVAVGNSEVKEGDRVLFSKFGYDEVEVGKVTFYVVSNNAILGIF